MVKIYASLYNYYNSKLADKMVDLSRFKDESFSLG
jgi:hypothetical protein